MDGNNCRATQAQGDEGAAPARAMESDDWRTQLLPDSRQKNVNKIMETLKGYLPVSGRQEGVEELKKIAVRFEEKIYTAATSQQDYLRRISLKKPTMETKSQDPMNNSIQPNAASSDQNALGPDSTAQTGNANAANSQEEVYQKQQPQEQQQEPQEQQQQNLLQPAQTQPSQQAMMQPPSMQSTSLSNLQQNQQSTVQQSTQSLLHQRQQSVMRQQQAPMLHQQQSSMLQQPILPVQQQQLIAQQTNIANLQQNQLMGQQNTMPDVQQKLVGQQSNYNSLLQQQLLNRLKNFQNMHQQQLGSQSNIAGVHQQQLSGSQQPGSSGSTSNQHPINLPQQSKVAVPQQMLQSNTTLLPSQGQQSQSQPAQQQMMSQSRSQRGQLQPPLGLQQHTNQLQREMQQRLQSSAPLLQQQNVMEQQKQLYQSQRAAPEASSNSIAQTGNANAADWQEELYQKIKSMKEMYLSELNDLYQRVASKLQQRPQNDEQIVKFKSFKTALKRIVLFFHLNKHDIQLIHKEELLTVEKYISYFFSSNQPGNPTSSPLQGRLSQSSMQFQQLQSLDGQTNSSMQPGLGSMAAMQQNNLTNLQHNSLSGVSTISNSQYRMKNTLQPGSLLDLGQGYSLNSLQQVATGSIQQNPFFGPKQQQQSVDQCVGFHHPQLKSGISSPQLHQALSPQQWRGKGKVEGDVVSPMMFEPYTSTVGGIEISPTPLDSTAQMGNANGADWQEEVYQKFKSMREMYSSKLIKLDQKIAFTMQQYPQLVEHLKEYKIAVEKIVFLLWVSKQDIGLEHKEKLPVVEEYISFFCELW